MVCPGPSEGLFTLLVSLLHPFHSLSHGQRGGGLAQPKEWPVTGWPQNGVPMCPTAVTPKDPSRSALKSLG